MGGGRRAHLGPRQGARPPAPHQGTAATAPRRQDQGWAIYTSGSDAPAVMALLERAGLDRSETAFNAGL